MSIKSVAVRAVAVVLGACFCAFGVALAGIGVWLATSEGSLLFGVVLGAFGLPFLGIGGFSGYKGLTAQVAWADGSVEIESGPDYGPGFGGE